MRSASGGLLVLVLLLVFGTGCRHQFEIRDRPIPFTDARIEATQAYAEARYGLDSHRITPRVIVLHWTSIPTLEDSYAAFVPESLPGARGDIAQASAVNVSVQFLIGKDGSTFRMMP
ncbi:MAG: N-acetylmuramoyl-L-alanine amidase, partial [Rhodothermales bacterium]|nr:N-acetylmuramoyl-L-alanine amidase [Rhodothermales bacterium]